MAAIRCTVWLCWWDEMRVVAIPSWFETQGFARLLTMRDRLEWPHPESLTENEAHLPSPRGVWGGGGGGGGGGGTYGYGAVDFR